MKFYFIHFNFGSSPLVCGNFFAYTNNCLDHLERCTQQFGGNFMPSAVVPKFEGITNIFQLSFPFDSDKNKRELPNRI